MKKTVLILTTFLLTALADRAFCAAPPVYDRSGVRIEELDVRRVDSLVEIHFTARIDRRAVRRNHSVVFAPLVTDGRWRQSLPPVVVHGPGSKIARHRREWVAEATLDFPQATLLKNGDVVRISRRVPFQRWMVGADLLLERTEGGCCSYVASEPALLAGNILFEKPAPRPVPTPVPLVETPQPVSMADTLAQAFPFVLPVEQHDPVQPFAEPVATTLEQDREQNLVVHFRLSSAHIDPGYMDNAHVLNNLIAAVNMIIESRNSRIEYLVIGGFASPEGGIRINGPLAWERAQAVKEYLLAHTVLKPDQIRTYSEASPWQLLRGMVERSDMPRREEVLHIIDTVPVWDGKRQIGRLGELMRLEPDGATYNYMLEEFFPYLRIGAYIRAFYSNK